MRSWWGLPTELSLRLVARRAEDWKGGRTHLDNSFT